MNTKTLILIRHAHRDTTDRTLDNGLSGLGKKQAKALTKYFRKHHGGETASILTSPSRRCMETIQGFGHPRKRRELMEQGKNESAPAFRARVARFAAWWKRQNLSPLVVACSHGDVLPALIRELTGARAELAKGGWAEITFHVERKFR